jgi:hypothetical protein
MDVPFQLACLIPENLIVNHSQPRKSDELKEGCFMCTFSRILNAISKDFRAGESDLVDSTMAMARSAWATSNFSISVGVATDMSRSKRRVPQESFTSS